MKRAELNAKYSAFVIFFDAVDGAMEVWPKASMAIAEAEAQTKQERLDQSGYEECGHYRALPKLPRRSIYKVHPGPLDNPQNPL